VTRQGKGDGGEENKVMTYPSLLVVTKGGDAHGEVVMIIRLRMSQCLMAMAMQKLMKQKR
jgi:hypothetical protein